MDMKRFPSWAMVRLALLCLTFYLPVSSMAAGEPPLLLASFGAVGDDRADDTQALQKAFREAAGRCLDGQGRTYRVRGSLRVATDFCLTNTRLRQDVEAFDTRLWIRGDCPLERNPAALADCGDPVMAERLPPGLDEYLFTRTLLIRPEPEGDSINVVMRNVRVDRGAVPASGARSDAAGIWIGNAAGLYLEDVEVVGGGKGFGVIIVNSSDVTVRRLWLHDLVWAPYDGDASLSLARVRDIGWNSVPIREFRRAGDQGASHSGFHGMRVQEQLSCLMIVGSDRVLLDDLRIDGCRARFEEGDVPWQADGIGIGQSSRDIRIEGAHISDTWEGIDVVGGGRGVEQIAIRNTKVTNSFGYGVRIGANSKDVALIDSAISRAGLAAVVLYGPVREMLVRQVRIDGVGSVDFAGALQRPWQQERAGVLVEGGSSAETATAYPTGVILDSVTVQGNHDCRFGLLNLTPHELMQTGIRVIGCETAIQHSPR